MGKIIVIEGVDGSGKETQAKKLYEKLKKMGLKVKMQSFPNYTSPSAAPVKMYLSGQIGSNARNTNAYQASILYAVDRFITMKQYESFLKEDGVLVLDRYTQSNMIHNGSKIDDLKERDKYLAWLNDFEFNVLSLPQADLVLFLDVPVEVGVTLRKDRALKAGTGKDIHEGDIEFLKKSYKAAKYAAKKFDWTTIKCTKNQNMLSIDQISEKIFKEVKKVLK